ncbi:ATP-binding protein [Gardnerella swidsinskii]|uniref:ATP-binding protein n=2 Tax=Bifidobacteriaceae TaxID=31953 RepID=UPI000E690587|nr:ATP-binding protein [Gardnerella swidsinskii]RIY28432.1 AAA family ATPase [Bifidobacteriaceae bacterium NR016]
MRMIFNRQSYIRKLNQLSWNGLVKIITGVRRAGKSFILNELFYNSLISQGVLQKNIIRFAFDADEDIDRLEPFANGEPVKIADKKLGYVINAKVFRRYIASQINDSDKFYIFLDEVQLLDNFVGTLNSYLRHANLDIYVTGSNSRFLSSDIVTEFKGRSTEVHVQPLTFAEYMESSSKTVSESWADYIVTGGIPLVARMQNVEEQINYLENLVKETYLKDVVQRNGVRKEQALSETLQVIASSIGAPVNPRKLSNTFISHGYGEITSATVSRFIDYYSDAFLVSKAQKYNIKGKKYIDSLFKIYFEDIGVRNALLNFRQIEESHIMENVIYNELRYRGYNVDIGEMNIAENTGRKDKNNHDIYAQKSLEIDFIATLGSEKYYIQSAPAMPTEEKSLREKRSLYYIDNSFKKIVVTKNGLHATRDNRGVVTMDLFDFLLNEDSLKL